MTSLLFSRLFENFPFFSRPIPSRELFDVCQILLKSNQIQEIFFMKQHQAPIPVHGLLRLPQVLSMIPISKSAWWEGCRTGRYPKPVKLGPRTTVWRAEDIAAFIERLGRQGEEHE